MLAEAGKRGLKVIMVLADNWYKTNGIDQYVEWGGSSKHQDFFTSGYIRSLYKNNIAFLAKRVNPLTGVKYADDTTIMAWNVANEGTQGRGEALGQRRAADWALWSAASAGALICTPRETKHTASIARPQPAARAAAMARCRTGACAVRPACSAPTLTALQCPRISDVCSFIKSVAPNHLVRPRPQTRRLSSNARDSPLHLLRLAWATRAFTALIPVAQP